LAVGSCFGYSKVPYLHGVFQHQLELGSLKFNASRLIPKRGAISIQINEVLKKAIGYGFVLPVVAVVLGAIAFSFITALL